MCHVATKSNQLLILRSWIYDCQKLQCGHRPLGSDASRTARLVNQARLERLHEEKHRVDKEHKHILERLVELDTRRRLFESEIDQTQTELVEKEDAASNRSLSTSVKSSHK